ncbi:MAG: Hsp70 family protein [Planctomycetia bacterium]|nr:Hsp70 family protein [Planctomycetia bacterium]
MISTQTPAAGKTPAVGIDLGTTYSAIARLDETGRPVTLVNGEGDLTTPSVVLIDGQDVVVGKEAVKALGTDGHRIAECMKRDVGQRLYHKALDGRQYPPEVLQALVLKKVASDAKRLVGEFSKVVVTVPAYFDEVRRKATQDAGYIAGLDVIDIINEPTAAAVAFGYQQGFLNTKGESSKPQKVLVYDLGGGTFDVTVMQIAGSDFRALATDGDVELGGRDWDNRLMQLVADEFQKQHGIDPRKNLNASARLWRECEDAKRTLSARSKATITFDFEGRAVRVEVAREKFIEITTDLLDRTRFTTRQALKDAGLDWGGIDRILLVGGSSRMPMVREMLKNLSAREPDASVSADEAVAQGAALRAGLILSRAEGIKPAFKIKNVNSHSLGVVGTDRTTGRKRTAVLIKRNTPLPAKVRREFKTQKAGQDSVLVQIVEGESANPDVCTAIGQCMITGLPKDLPAMSPVNVEFQYASNGRLAVSVQVPGTDRQAKQEIMRASGLSQEHLDQWRSWVAGVWKN